MLNYAEVREESYYAQKYASIMCQGLYTTTANVCHVEGCNQGLLEVIGL